MSLGAEAYDELEMNVTAADLDPYTSGPWPDQKKKSSKGEVKRVDPFFHDLFLAF